MAATLPPAEKPDAVRTRSRIIYSFWFVILVLGLPTWWQTTSITRAALPLEDMLSWSDKPEYHHRYIVPVRIAAPEIPCEAAAKTITEVESLVNENSVACGLEISAEHVRYTSAKSEGKSAQDSSCSAVEVSPNDHAITLDIELRPGTAFHLDVSSGATPAIATYDSNNLGALAVDLAEALKQMLSEEQGTAAYEYLYKGSSDRSLTDFFNRLPGDTQQLIAGSAARAFKPSPDYHLTFSLFTPGGYPSGWEIDTALNQYIQPLVHALSKSANFSIATQIQLYSTFSPSIEPYQKDNIDGWFLKRNDLTAFVNTAEWPLSPSIGSGPTINFVLYIPSSKQAPLRIEGNNGASILGGSWIIPQWGGITILNAPIVRNDPDINREDTIAYLSADLLKPAFDLFQSQLLSLLGVPTTPTLSLPLRLKAFQRLSALSLHLRTRSNLGSLARLAQHLNSIPIPRHVSELVDSAIESLKAYRGQSNGGIKIAAANGGYKASEKAFFDKSMVGQVYFPDEHKVAVYLPLLGPIGVPLLVGLIRELKALAARLKR